MGRIETRPRITQDNFQVSEVVNYDRTKEFIEGFKQGLSHSMQFIAALRKINPDITPSDYFQRSDDAAKIPMTVTLSKKYNNYKVTYEAEEDSEILWIKRINEDGSYGTLMLFAGKPQFDGAQAVNEGQVGWSSTVMGKGIDGEDIIKRYNYHYNDMLALTWAGDILEEL